MAYTRMTGEDKAVKMFGFDVPIVKNAYTVGKIRALNGKELYIYGSPIDMRNLAKALRTQTVKVDRKIYDSYVQGYTTGLTIAYNTVVAELEELVK
jgi:hypothetical protein